MTERLRPCCHICAGLGYILPVSNGTAWCKKLRFTNGTAETGCAYFVQHFKATADMVPHWTGYLNTWERESEKAPPPSPKAGVVSAGLVTRTDQAGHGR